MARLGEAYSWTPDESGPVRLTRQEHAGSLASLSPYAKTLARKPLTDVGPLPIPLHGLLQHAINTINHIMAGRAGYVVLSQPQIHSIIDAICNRNSANGNGQLATLFLNNVQQHPDLDALAMNDRDLYWSVNILMTLLRCQSA